MVFVLLSASRALVSSPQRSRPRGRRTDDPAHTVYKSYTALRYFDPLPDPGIVASRARGRRDRPAAAEAVPRAPRGRKMAPGDPLKPLHIPTSGLYR